MANKVSFIIQLKDQFSRTGAKLRQTFSKADKQARTLDNTLRGRLTQSLSGVHAQALTAAKGLATLATATATIRIGAGFQDAIAELSAITGAEGADLKALSDDVMRAAKVFGTSQDIVARAFTQVASAKSELLKTPGAVATVTTEALRLAKAAGIDVPDAIRASVGALNQFGVGADQASRFVNVLAAGAKVGASQVGETAEALKNAGTVAAQFGLSFEQTNAILQVFAKNELKGAEAGTALRATLSKLEGFAGGRFAPSKLGIIKSLQMIKTLGLSNSQVIKQFGQENLRSILIMQQNIPLLRQWTRELTGTSVASEQADKRLATFNARVSKAGTALKSVGIKVFMGFEPVLSGAVDLFTHLLNSIEGVTSALGSLLGQVAGALAMFDFGGTDFFSWESIKGKFGEAFGSFSWAKAGSEFGAAFGLEALRVPTATSGTGTVNGSIVVSATQGSRVEKTSMQSASGAGFNLGFNMVGG